MSDVLFTCFVSTYRAYIHVVLNVLGASLINRVACFDDWNAPRKQISESRDQLSWSTIMAQGPTLLLHGESMEVLYITKLQSKVGVNFSVSSGQRAGKVDLLRRKAHSVAKM